MKIELYYHWKQYDWQDEGCFDISTCDMSEYGPERVLLKIVEVEIPDASEPSRDLIVKHRLATLQKEKQELQAETQIKLNNIEDKIRQLSAITYQE